MTYPMTEEGPSYDDDGVLNLYPEPRRTTMTKAEAIMRDVEGFQEVLAARERNLAKVQAEILTHSEAIDRLEAQAIKWEQGIDAIEAAIGELEQELEELPLDLTPTGEGDDTDAGDDWEGAGFTVGELPLD